MYVKYESEAGGYEIIHKRGAINHINEYFNLDRKVLIVTDDGVPREYSERVAGQCKEPYVVTLLQGEASKNVDNYLLLLRTMLEAGFTRSDCVAAVGGGMCGDIGAFAASCYMRGIEFCNIPTTVLSMVDSSIGGKTAIDFEGVKNVIGTFFMPKAVIIDTDVLKTLDKRQFASGMAEAVKMAVTFDETLFEYIERSTGSDEDIDYIIEAANRIKKKVVEEDPREKGLRKALNFGHTIGHAIESAHKGELLHGECVALGMTVMCGNSVKERLIKVLSDYKLPTVIEDDMSSLTEFIKHDKKAKGDSITVVYCNKAGTFEFRVMTSDELTALK